MYYIYIYIREQKSVVGNVDFNIQLGSNASGVLLESLFSELDNCDITVQKVCNTLILIPFISFFRLYLTKTERKYLIFDTVI